MKASKKLGIAVIGAGRIGTLRARLSAKHPSVGFLAISDLDPARAATLAKTTGADVHSANNFEMIEHPEVTAVFGETASRYAATDAGAPGVRPQYTAGFYGCFVLDLDGFKIEAVVREALSA